MVKRQSSSIERTRALADPLRLELVLLSLMKISAKLRRPKVVHAAFFGQLVPISAQVLDHSMRYVQASHLLGSAGAIGRGRRGAEWRAERSVAFFLGACTGFFSLQAR